jgi:hypothetical protein
LSAKDNLPAWLTEKSEGQKMKPAKSRCNGRRVKSSANETNQSSPNSTAAPSPASPSHRGGIFSIPREVLKRFANPIPRTTPDGEPIH